MNAMIVTNKGSSAWQQQVRGLYLGGILLAGATLALAGCSGGSDGSAGAVQAHVAQAGGKVMGGRQPVAGSTVTLYAAGTTGAGSGAALSPTTTTGSDGTWSLTFTCPGAGTEIYAVVTGGNAGGGTNSNLALSAMLGPCGESSTPLPTNADINEVSTVASAYALAQFLDATGQKPGASSTNSAGLANAIATIANLESNGVTQASPVTGASGTSPGAALNTLANLVATCVNSAGGTAGDTSACGQFFTQATPSGGTAPTTTLQAVLDIALNPGHNATALYNLTSASGPYQTPAPLAAAPNDWTLAINFSFAASQGVGTENAIAIDVQGNPWVALNGTDGGTNGGNGAVLKLTPQGSVTGTFDDNGNVNFPAGLAIDSSGNVWVSNQGNSNISGLTSAGATLGASPFSSTHMNNPSQIAVDSSGNVWVYEQNASYFTKLVQSSAYAGTDFGAFDATSPGGLAIDGSGDAWLLNELGTDLYESSNSGTQIGSTYSGNNLAAIKGGIAIDASNNVWAIGTGTVNEYVKSSSYAATTYTDSTLHPISDSNFAIDGAGNLWIPNKVSNTVGVRVLSSAGAAVSTSANGMYATTSGLFGSSPAGVAIDASGNVWIGGNATGNVVELVGAAKPVKTPLIGAPLQP
jgi:sugar lactone lactonase YvrE